jgi:hypothetical protein
MMRVLRMLILSAAVALAAPPVQAQDKPSARESAAERRAARRAAARAKKKKADKPTPEAKPAADDKPVPESAAAAAAPAPAPVLDDATVRKEGETEVKTVEFSGLDIEGQLKTPQLLYFLTRLRAEFGRPRLPHRSFMPELSRSSGEKALR